MDVLEYTKKYAERYAKTYGISTDEAMKHAIVQEVAKGYDEAGESEEDYE